MISKATSLKRLAVLFILGFFLWLVPNPAGLEQQGWHLFIIFIIVIIGIVMDFLPMGVMMVISLTVCVLTNTLTLEQALYGFSSNIVWLITIAFFIARAVIKSNLARRVSCFLIYKFGNSLLGISYSLVLTEFLLAPIIPSAIARSGGIIFPIAKSISEQFASIEDNKIRAFIMQVCFQGNVISSAMFLTAMAGNPLIVKIANSLDVEINWGTWALGAIIPGIINLLIMPIILYFTICPKAKSIPRISQLARTSLNEIGHVSRNEIIVSITFCGLILFWILGKLFGIDATTAALLGFLVLIITDVINWKDVVLERQAWKTFVWFGSFIALSEYLSTFGVTRWIGANISVVLADKDPFLAIIILMAVFFYMHYFFASITVYSSVMYSTFFLMLTTLQLPPLVAAMVLAFFANLSGCLTHYSISSAPIFFTESQLSIKSWWQIGFIMSIVNILIWSLIGGIWWQVLGWW